MREKFGKGLAKYQQLHYNNICRKKFARYCGSMAEQLIRNEQVVSSILTSSSKQLPKLSFRRLLFVLRPPTNSVYWKSSAKARTK